MYVCTYVCVFSYCIYPYVYVYVLQCVGFMVPVAMISLRGHRFQRPVFLHSGSGVAQEYVRKHGLRKLLGRDHRPKKTVKRAFYREYLGYLLNRHPACGDMNKGARASIWVGACVFMVVAKNIQSPFLTCSRSHWCRTWCSALYQLECKYPALDSYQMVRSRLKMFWL